MTLIQFRRSSAAQWQSQNTLLASGEFGFESDTRKFKIGPGNWNSLDYIDAPTVLAEIAHDMIDADLAARGISFTDIGGGEGFFTIGGVPISGTLVPPAATLSGVAGAQDAIDQATGSFPAYAYGMVGDGVTDDSDAILAAIAAAKEAGGGTVTLDHPKVPAPQIKIVKDIYVPGTVNLRGGGGGKDSDGCAFICSGEVARIRFGDGTDNESRGGWSGGFNIHGNGEGDPTGLLYLNLVVSRTFQAIEVRGGVGDGILIEQTQNSLFLVVDSIGNAGADMVLDKGAGGNLFLRCELATGGECSLEIKETTGTGPYPDPQHNRFVHCILETYGSTGETMLKVSAGSGNVFDSPVFSAGAATLSSGYLITAAGAGITLRDAKFFGGSAHGAVKVVAATRVEVEGTTLVKNCTTAWTVDAAGFYELRGSITYASVTTRFNLINGATVGPSFYTSPAIPELVSYDPAVFNYGKRFKRATDAGMRMQITADGVLQYNDGTGTSALASMSYNAAQADLLFTSLRITKRFARVEGIQTLSSDGAVTLDCLLGSVHFINLAANATSMSITNAVNGLELNITLIQDAAGGRTYVFPTNCKFAGGTPPSDTTADTRTTVQFHYDSSVASWFEVSRAVAVPKA